MVKKKKPWYKKIRKTWKIKPYTKVHKDKSKYDRKKIKKQTEKEITDNT